MSIVTLPDDDLNRTLAHFRPGDVEPMGIAGGTYTITVSGAQTNGKFCIVEMVVPPGGGPPMHRHDFEETFVIVEGEIEATFRGATAVIRAGETVNIPANAPHRFQNVSGGTAKLICICSPAGQDEFFREVMAVAPAERPGKSRELAPKYRVEFVG
ncbi:hypothetical protein F183_A25430 [Bryobacterales bacterium F-183]|nr:hypothetical protein F183_A25430 [Bryobacterales bacterium F-183]